MNDATASLNVSLGDSLGVSPRDSSAQCLVEIVELKWLLAGHGVKLHVERLQADREYARQTLARAACVPNAALRAAAARLRCALGLDTP